MIDVLYFKDEYRFLSNFWHSPVVYESKIYPTVEHAYHAAKTIDLEERKQFQDFEMTPGQSKKVGRTVTLRDDWNVIKLNVMQVLVTQKFSKYHELRKKLLEIDGKIVEGNSWGDT